MLEAMEGITHVLLQRGDSMLIQYSVHPPVVCDMIYAYDTYTRAFWSDSKSGTCSKKHIRQSASIIGSPRCYQKCASQIQQQ